MAGDAHEGSTGGVAEDSCRLRLLHVDREQRLEALAQEHESILCSEPRLTALQISELHPPVKGEREEGHLHETQSMSVWIFCLSGQEGQCISRTKTRARQRICTPFFTSQNKWNEKENGMQQERGH